MLKVNERQLADAPSPVAQWADLALGMTGIRVKVQLRGNRLHILCEGRECPDRQTMLARLVQALHATQLEALVPVHQLPLSQVCLYGRIKGQKRPEWTELIDLDALGSSDSVRIEVLDRASKVENEAEFLLQPEHSTSPSLQELARSGKPEAIALILSETLSQLGVGVKVATKARVEKRLSSLQQGSGDFPADAESSVARRLWVFCESAYSPDPSLVATPVAQKLRELQLEGFRDAAILSQVTGEAAPDWMLRVDLTPPEEMLKQWARWGDPEAIARLLDPAIAAQQVQLSAILKESTLHISCTRRAEGAAGSPPDKRLCMAAIAPLLLSLAPRGIYAATIYGHEAQEAPPVWVDWVELPATQNPELAKSALKLAQEGDEPAIAFLIGRNVNPDLDWRLATGGIRIQVRLKEDLLHIMSDAPVCPSQRLVAAPSAQLVQTLNIIGVRGVRIYGRRAGQKQPWWQYSLDFVNRDRQKPEAAPEFPKSDDYGDDLLLEAEERGLRPIPIERAKIVWQQTSQEIVQNLARQMVRSQLFVPSEEPQNFPALPGKVSYQGAKLALVWGTVGVLMTLGGDLFLGQMLQPSATQGSRTPTAVEAVAAISAETENGREETSRSSEEALPIPPLALQQSRNQQQEKVFNAAGFTKQGNSEPAAQKTDTLASPYPSFNNPQLDAKLALYQQRVLESGPPDILIVGSSRALRGVDPIALEKALAQQGHGDLQVFNLGINGATAQVVELILRRVLTPEQLPRLIILADGARAFNSSRMDITFTSMMESPGYQKLIAGTFPRANKLEAKADNALEPFTAVPVVPGTANNFFSANFRNLDSWLNQSIATWSASYTQRDRLQTLLSSTLQNTFNFNKPDPAQKQQPATVAQRSLDWYGFLPISIRFDPTTYYQKHAKVSGEYDNDYRDFTLAGSQSLALESLIQFAQANKIPLVIVNLPLTQDYLDPVRSKYEQEFQLSMMRLSLSRGFTFRDWSQLWPTRNEFFSDPSHLNRYGAAAVAIRLAQDPLIPWPKASK